MKAFFALLLLLTWIPGAARAAVYAVGPGQDIAELSDVPWEDLKPGDNVTVHGGIHSGNVKITSRGTADRPITVMAAPGTAPQSTGPLMFIGASYVVIDGITVQDTRWPGFMIRQGSEGITVINSTVYNAAMGVWIADGAGMNHRILNNVLKNNRTFGIGIDNVSNAPGRETVIAGNVISGHKSHGIEIIGNYYIVEGNTVHGNGWDVKGSSGIHLFAKNAKAGTGKHNIIRYNLAYGNKDNGSQDGNGIQVDQWCDDNQVYFNVAFGNDGAGISLYDASDNLVANNTLSGNARGQGHLFPGELFLGGDEKADHVRGNTVVNNIFHATRTGSYAVYVDPRAASGGQTIANNFLYRSGPGDLYVWRDEAGSAIGAWNAAKTGAPDIAADPRFSDAGRPLAGGLTILPSSPAAGKGLALKLNKVRDFTGGPVPVLPIGAYAAR